MSLTIRLTGTGGAQQVPVFGCDCAACQRPASMRPLSPPPADAVGAL